MLINPKKLNAFLTKLVRSLSSIAFGNDQFFVISIVLYPSLTRLFVPLPETVEIVILLVLFLSLSLTMLLIIENAKMQKNIIEMILRIMGGFFCRFP